MGRFHRHDDGTTHTARRGHDTARGRRPLRLRHGTRARDRPRADLHRERPRRRREPTSAFADAGVVCLNVMSSPGAGKTTVLAATLTHLRERGLRAGVVEGDIETSIDADRLRGLAQQVSLLNTGNGFGGECHLDAPMVARALHAARSGRPRRRPRRERRQPRLPRGVRRGCAPASDGLLRHRGRGQATEVPRDVPLGRRSARQQDRPAPLSRPRHRPAGAQHPHGQPEPQLCSG